MTTSLKRRLEQLEAKRGDPIDAYLESLSDEELEAKIAALSAQLREMLKATGADVEGMSDEEVSARLAAIDAEQNGGAK